MFGETIKFIKIYGLFCVSSVALFYFLSIFMELPHLSLEEIFRYLFFSIFTINLIFLTLSVLFSIRNSISYFFLICILNTLLPISIWFVHYEYIRNNRPYYLTGMEGIALFLFGGLSIATTIIGVIIFILMRYFITHRRNSM